MSFTYCLSYTFYKLIPNWYDKKNANNNSKRIYSPKDNNRDHISVYDKREFILLWEKLVLLERDGRGCFQRLNTSFRSIILVNVTLCECILASYPPRTFAMWVTYHSSHIMRNVRGLNFLYSPLFTTGIYLFSGTYSAYTYFHTLSQRQTYL